MIIAICIICGICHFGGLIVLGFGGGYFGTKNAREDTRSAGRFRFSGGPALHWLEGTKQVSMRTRAVDISDYGAKLIAGKPLEVGKTVHLLIPEMGLTGRVVVRHCTGQLNGYALGLEFIGPPSRSGAKSIKLSRRGNEERVEIIGT
jgi:hypothetical protein